jgi:hypothetical protein
MGLLEYEESIGLSHKGAEILDLCRLGFPTAPPAPGEKVLRVPVQNATLWRTLFGGLITTCGGNGLDVRLGREMRKLCGLPLLDDLEDGDAEPVGGDAA